MFDGAKSSNRTHGDVAVLVMPTVSAPAALPEIVTLVTVLKYEMVVAVVAFGPVTVSESGLPLTFVPVTTKVFELSLPAATMVT